MAEHGDEEWEQGCALSEAGQRDDAIRVWQEGLRRNPDHADVRYNIGVALYESGKEEEAVATWRETLRRNPNFWQAHRDLGYIYWTRFRAHKKRHDLRAARDAYAQVVALRPVEDAASAKLFYWIGRMEGKFGSRRAAVAALQRAIQADPSHQAAYFWLGRWQWLQGQWRAGWRTTKALTELPDYDAAECFRCVGRLFLRLLVTGAVIGGVVAVVRRMTRRDQEG